MSARIAPRADSIGIAFSPHLPRFVRRDKRGDKDDPERDEHHDAEPLAPPAGFGASEAGGRLPPSTIFEAALLGNQQAVDPLSPYEMERLMRNEWAPPVYGFHLTDKVI